MPSARLIGKELRQASAERTVASRIRTLNAVIPEIDLHRPPWERSRSHACRRGEADCTQQMHRVGRAMDAAKCGSRQQGTWQAQALRHANAALRFEPGDALRDQNVGLVVFRIETIVDVERAAERRLGARQPIFPVAVVAQDELGPAGTKRAVTVEDDDRSIVTEFWNGRVPAIAVGLAYSADHDSITPPPSPAPPFVARPAAARPARARAA